MKNVRTLILFILMIAFAVGLFKNISYPLLWQDESETTMFGQRILQFGYPKVHDGKNTLYFVDLPDKAIAIKRGWDAYVGTPWSHFYLAAVGVFMASRIDNIYLKTALVRIPFAIVGSLGLIILAFSIRRLFSKTSDWVSALILFLILEVLSVSLQLHLREVRYYSILMFLLALFTWVFSSYAITKTLSYGWYFFLLIIISLLTIFTFFPTVLVLILVVSAWYMASFVTRIASNRNGLLKINPQVGGKLRWLFRELLPVIVIVLLTIPLASFFNYFNISSALSRVVHFDPMMYLSNLVTILSFLFRYEFLFLIFAARVLSSYLRQRDSSLIVRMAELLSTLALIYILVLARFPYIFQRYIIVIQPILALTFVLDVKIIFDALKGQSRDLAIMIFGTLFITFVPSKIVLLSNHFYEFIHQYKGPLDFAIPYIKANFKDPGRLTIATNYEEGSYMYYLGSKVVGGYVLNNYTEDKLAKPDIIIKRKSWNDRENFLSDFLKDGSFRNVVFDVYDYSFNNIPELSGYWPLTHLFKTKTAVNDSEKLSIYVRD